MTIQNYQNQNSQVQKTYIEVLQEVQDQSLENQAYALANWCDTNNAGLFKRLAAIRYLFKQWKCLVNVKCSLPPLRQNSFYNLNPHNGFFLHAYTVVHAFVHQ